MWRRFAIVLDSGVCGSLFQLYRANKRVSAQIATCDIELLCEDERLKLAHDDLNQMLTLSIQRLERIENKAMGTLLGIGVGLAVFGSTSGVFGAEGLLVSASSIVRGIAATALLLAMMYLIFSGLLALSAYRVGEVYRPTLFDQVPIGGATRLAVTILYSIEQNQRVAIIRSNKLTSSFNCLRNGLFMVLILGLLVVYATWSVNF